MSKKAIKADKYRVIKSITNIDYAEVNHWENEVLESNMNIDTLRALISRLDIALQCMNNIEEKHGSGLVTCGLQKEGLPIPIFGRIEQAPQ